MKKEELGLTDELATKIIEMHGKKRGFTLPRFVKGLGLGINDNGTSAIHEHILLNHRICVSYILIIRW